MSNQEERPDRPWDTVVVASNRGPLEYQHRADGTIHARRGSGGVVTALSAIAGKLPLTWVAAPMTDADHQVAAGEPAPPSPFPVRFVDLDPKTYRKYYERFANRLLWFLQHYMLDVACEPRIDRRTYDAWETGYVPANQAFAREIASAIATAREPLVLVQDYHLYLTPGLVRELNPAARIQHFTHIPWPEPRYWQLLAEMMRLEIYRGLLGADILGFQTRRDARNFLDCVGECLPEYPVDRGRAEVRVDGRRVAVRVYPISIDVDQLRRLADSAEVRHHRERLLPLTGDKTIVRVDRLEPSKNIVRGLDALDDLLQRRPDLVGKVRMLAFLVPSREALPVYRSYRKDVFARVDQINARYGDGSYLPVTVFYENNYRQAIAGMTLSDVLLVNPVVDGMNLVAKEGPIVNRRDGVEILSEGAGAHDQLGQWAVSVAPADLVGTSQALEAALEMPARERADRIAALRAAVAREDIHWWLDRQLDDLAALTGHPSGGARVLRAA